MINWVMLIMHNGSWRKREQGENFSLDSIRRKTRDMCPLGRDPNFTSVVRKAKNFSPRPYAAADANGAMGCDQKSFITLIVWR